MFGYIRPFYSELRIREYHYYRGVYCGLCRAQGHCTGQCSRMMLSYDFAFLALVRLALRGGNPTEEQVSRPVRFERRRCLPHPLRRRASLQGGNETDYVAACAALLNYHKLLDDRADEKGGRRLRAVLLSLPLGGMYRRARRRYPALANEIDQTMQAFNRTEKETVDSADRPAAAFGEVLAVLFSHGLTGNAATIARHVGFHIGKWLYLADAVDDFSEDICRDRFNPLRCLYGDAALTEERKQALSVAMISELRSANDALALLSIDDEQCMPELRVLLDHMLTVALPLTTDALINGSYHQKDQNGADALLSAATDD